MIDHAEFIKRMQTDQKDCFNCGKPLGEHPVECGVCQELQCSEKCKREHIASMDEI